MGRPTPASSAKVASTCRPQLGRLWRHQDGLLDLDLHASAAQAQLQAVGAGCSCSRSSLGARVCSYAAVCTRSPAF